jgi:[ribosomal protein S5]-alanine N-acetyltransferase
MKLLFETKNLLLRPLELTDAEAMFLMDSNPNVHNYLWQKPAQQIEEVIKVIDYVQSQYKKNNIGRFATVLKETGEFIGWTGIKFVDDHTENGNTNFYDYGYRLDERFWGKGYATEATQFWINHAFNDMKLENLNAYTHCQNDASNHILKKTGFNFMEEYTAEDGIQWNWWQITKQF